MEPGEPGAGGKGSGAARGTLAGWSQGSQLAGWLPGAKEPARALGPESKKKMKKKVLGWVAGWLAGWVAGWLAGARG